jgi:hypothetical protein
MGAFEPHSAALAVSRGRQIHAADVIALLREVYADGIATREEAEELIAFDHTLTEPTPGWSEFFAATIADHVTRRLAPAGIVDGEKASWLIGALSRGWHAATPAGFAAVLRVIESVQDVSSCLAAYAIWQLRSAVINGGKPASSVRLNLNRAVDFDTAALIRRILLGSVGQSAAPVSREEAEALFDLHDLAASGTNDADFDDLFFKSIAHHLVAHVGGQVPPRGEALARQSSFPDGTLASLTADETAWLASQIMRDGRPTKIEFALLQYFAYGAGDTDHAARELMIRAA